MKFKNKNAEWEDVPEEPKDIWWLDNEGCVNHASGDFNDSFRKNRKIGNYFLSREEAEKAVEKLKAWKRLKDKKIFIWLDYFDYRSQDGAFRVEFKDNLSSDELDQVNDDLDLIFGGEDDENS